MLLRPIMQKTVMFGAIKAFGEPSRTIFTGMRCTTLMKLPVAFEIWRRKIASYPTHSRLGILPSSKDGSQGANGHNPVSRRGRKHESSGEPTTRSTAPGKGRGAWNGRLSAQSPARRSRSSGRSRDHARSKSRSKFYGREPWHDELWLVQPGWAFPPLGLPHPPEEFCCLRSN